jgi:hypothetical protein
MDISATGRYLAIPCRIEMAGHCAVSIKLATVRIATSPASSA